MKPSGKGGKRERLDPFEVRLSLVIGLVSWILSRRGGCSYWATRRYNLGCGRGWVLAGAREYLVERVFEVQKANEPSLFHFPRPLRHFATARLKFKPHRIHQRNPLPDPTMIAPI